MIEPVELNREIPEKTCPVCERDFEGLNTEQALRLHQINQIAGVSIQIFNFLALVAESPTPRMTKLCTVLPDSMIQVEGVPVISLWAGFGDDTPISRLENRVAEIERLEAREKELVQVLKSIAASRSDKASFLKEVARKRIE